LRDVAWISVFDAAISTIIEAPTGTSNTTESQNVWDSEKSPNAIPKQPAAMATHAPRPWTCRRAARLRAPPSAPMPDAAISVPSSRAPP
jgi:hypothetical protein